MRDVALVMPKMSMTMEQGQIVVWHMEPGAHVRAGEIPPTDTVVFLHTGGMPALFTREFVATRV